ncbi:hypothetical protein ACV35C_30755, partial [Pseudomonas aeruginosa]
SMRTVTPAMPMNTARLNTGAGARPSSATSEIGGNARMLVTLLFFILGSLIATQHVGWWFALPSLPPISLV